MFVSKSSYSTGGGGKGWADISVGPGKGLVQGFTLCVEHGEEGTSAQVRLLRVTAISTNSRGDPEKVAALGVFVVPLCKNGTVISYTFDSLCEASIVRIEHFANYGHREVITTGKLSLFVTKPSKQ